MSAVPIPDPEMGTQQVPGKCDFTSVLASWSSIQRLSKKEKKKNQKMEFSEWMMAGWEGGETGRSMDGEMDGKS